MCIPVRYLHKYFLQENNNFLINFTTEVLQKQYLPTNARITVSSGAAGNDTVTLNSSICSKSTVTIGWYKLTNHFSFESFPSGNIKNIILKCPEVPGSQKFTKSWLARLLSYPPHDIGRGTIRA